MRKWIALATGILVLLVANYTIYSREQLLKEGRVVLLELAPVDPRSLMQGDYMALRFKAADAIPRPATVEEQARDGFIVVALDGQGVGTVARLDNGAPLGANEVRMRYRVRDGNVRFATDAFFFQEGDAQLYEGARYGEFRVGSDGDSILTGLRGKGLEALGRQLVEWSGGHGFRAVELSAGAAVTGIHEPWFSNLDPGSARLDSNRMRALHGRPDCVRGCPS